MGGAPPDGLKQKSGSRSKHAGPGGVSGCEDPRPAARLLVDLKSSRNARLMALRRGYWIRRGTGVSKCKMSPNGANVKRRQSIPTTFRLAAPPFYKGHLRPTNPIILPPPR
jgi:hypothetical protein